MIFGYTYKLLKIMEDLFIIKQGKFLYIYKLPEKWNLIFFMCSTHFKKAIQKFSKFLD